MEKKRLDFKKEIRVMNDEERNEIDVGLYLNC